MLLLRCRMHQISDYNLIWHVFKSALDTAATASIVYKRILYPYLHAANWAGISLLLLILT